jgi:hypothetical protein
MYKNFDEAREHAVKTYSVGFAVFDKGCVVGNKTIDSYPYFENIDELRRKYREYTGKETSAPNKIILNLQDEPWKFYSKPQRFLSDEDIAWKEVMRARPSKLICSVRNGKVIYPKYLKTPGLGS